MSARGSGAADAPLTSCARYGDLGGRPGRRNRRALAEQEQVEEKKERGGGGFDPCSSWNAKDGSAKEERVPVARFSS